ncbi:hypothetical protein [Pseudonocardia aurantiaca]|uniref:Cell division protein FtsL n=2 Tax=Pseudonocardia aurantiaca TaxID=75290 RepID=A0ABW4FFE5_9PSEU
MSAPVTERGRATTRTASIPAQRGEPGDRQQGRAALPGEQKAGQRSARRAYARRDDRLRRLVGGRPVRTSAPTGRAQFVLLIMALLAVGLVATLWFSTAAAADSYRLQDARAEARALSQQAERLRREVAVAESAPELARRAAGLGMVPVQDPARIVVVPDGGVSVVGEPRAAVPPARPQAPAAPAPAPAPAPSGPGAEQPQPPVAPAEPGPAQLASGVDGAQQGTEGRQATAGPTVVAQGAGDQSTAPGASTAGTGNG